MKQQVRTEGRRVPSLGTTRPTRRSYNDESSLKSRLTTLRTINDLAKCPRKRGKAELGKHLQGKKIDPRGAMRAKCYECMGYYVDGAVDCGMLSCPLYPFMPYRTEVGMLDV